MATQDEKTRSSAYTEDRWLLGAICFVTVAGIAGLGLVLYSPRADAAMIAVMAGFVGAALAALAAALKGAQLLRKLDEQDQPLYRIDHAVNGGMNAKFAAQDKEIAEMKAMLERLGQGE